MAAIDSSLLKIILPILILQLILMISALVSCIKTPYTRGPKWLWIILILFTNLIGPILYFVIGKKDQ